MHISLNDLLFALSKSLDHVEHELLGITTNHGKRIACISMKLCTAMSMPEADVFDMASCAVLHDNALAMYMLESTPAQYSSLENIRSHCPAGEANAASFPFQGDTRGIILHHHENWNGSGYHGLAGNDIPLRAAVLRLADNMDLHLRLGTAAPDLPAVRAHVTRRVGTVYAPPAAEALLDTFGPDDFHALADDRIDSTLAAIMPVVKRKMTTTQLLDVCRVFAAIIDAKSPFTWSHSGGIARKARIMATRYGLDGERCDKIEIAALLHDVGKLATPVHILEKPGPLTSEELAVMQEHAPAGAAILHGVAGLEDIALWACSHHEKLDGTGYPAGLSGDELGFESRLLACCDIFQALSEDRPYRKPMQPAEVEAVMEKMANQGLLDRKIVRDMLEAARDMDDFNEASG